MNCYRQPVCVEGPSQSLSFKIDFLVLTSRSRAHRYIFDCYTSSKAGIAQALAKARSSISISFPAFGLRPTYGPPSLEAIAEELLAVMREFEISDRVGYFVADKACPCL